MSLPYTKQSVNTGNGTGTATQSEHQSDTAQPPYRASTHAKSALNVISRIERKLAQYNASQNVFKRWLFEILSVATSAICMGAIIVLLRFMENQPLEKWPLGSVLITTLSKIASAALILPISEAIGQLKWSWFYGEKSKDAFDFEIFDKASRGAWGSVLLLVRTRGKSLAALGALLTVLLLAIDTFFQQVRDLPERLSLRGQGLIPRVVRYEPDVVSTYQNGSLHPILQGNQDMISALRPYLYDQNGTQHSWSGSSSQVEFPLFCPTSVCTWESYQTLGVCSACVDISNMLKYACLPSKMDWILNSTGVRTENTWQNGTACGYFLNATSPHPVLMSGYRVDNGDSSALGETLLMRTLPLITNPTRTSLYGGSINFKHISRPIVDALIVSSADGTVDSVYRKEIPVAHECVLSWCIKTLQSSYSWGNYVENVKETIINTTETPYPWSTRDIPGAASTITQYDGNITIYPLDNSQDGFGYGLSNDSFVEIVPLFDDIFPSYITVANKTAERFLKIKTSFRDRIMFRAVRFSPWLAPNNVTHHMERIATAVTNAIRSDYASREFMAGQALSPETYIKVNWAWLAFPLAMLCLCIVFLVATMLKTSPDGNGGDIGAWKTSAMPTLMYSLPQPARQDLTTAGAWGSGNSGGMKRVKIRLLPDQGWRASGYICASPTSTRRNQSPPPPGWL